MNAERPSLTAANRTETRKHVHALRARGILPAVVYGHGFPSRNLALDAHTFELARRGSGPNTLFDLRVDNEPPVPALVHGVQVHPVTRRPLHVDLFAVRMTEELVVDVPVVTVGRSAAVEGGGTLQHLLDAVRVRALPDHLPQQIEISIESLRTYDDAIHVSDLAIPADVHLVTDVHEVVARVLPPRVEAEATAEAAAESPAGTQSAEAGAGAEA